MSLPIEGIKDQHESLAGRRADIFCTAGPCILNYHIYFDTID